MFQVMFRYSTRTGLNEFTYWLNYLNIGIVVTRLWGEPWVDDTTKKIIYWLRILQLHASQDIFHINQGDNWYSLIRYARENKKMFSVNKIRKSIMPSLNEFFYSRQKWHTITRKLAKMIDNKGKWFHREAWVIQSNT